MRDAEVPVAIREVAWLTLENPAMSMADARAELVALGNTILEEDPVGRRFKVADTVIELEPGGLDNAPPEWQAAARGDNL